MKRIRFHLDEHVDPRIAFALRRVDIDVTTTVEAQLRTSNDENQWHYARNEQRVLVTCDTDFPDRANYDLHHPGIVYFDKDTRTIGDVVEWLTLIHGAMSAEEIDGLIEYVPKR